MSDAWRLVERLTIDEHDFESMHATHAEAYARGRQFCCARGAMFVRIYAPDATLAHEWSRDDNRWIAHADLSTR